MGCNAVVFIGLRRPSGVLRTLPENSFSQNVFSTPLFNVLLLPYGYATHAQQSAGMVRSTPDSQRKPVLSAVVHYLFGVGGVSPPV